MSITEKRLNKVAGDIIDTLMPQDPPPSDLQKQIFHRLVKVLIMQAIDGSKGDTSETMEVKEGALETPNISNGEQSSQSNVVRPQGTKNGK